MSKTKQCKCTFIKGTGFIYKECKYHRKHCRYFDCKIKIKLDTEYCTEHTKIMSEASKLMIDAYGGSDF